MLADNWLDLALTHASTQWLRRALSLLLPKLVAGEISDEAFASSILEFLTARELTTPAQQKNYRSNVAQSLKSFNPQHPAIKLVNLSTEEFRELNDAQRGRLGQVKPKYLTSQTAETLVERATAMLDSSEWAEVGAGLGVLIGRRISEILLSRFAPKSAYTILFSDPSKKPEIRQDFTIEIYTLAPAEQVLKAIAKLQSGLETEDLKLKSLTPKQARQAVNSKYSGAVANACDRHFADLVPKRQDKENLYTHIFRAVYATIAAHWFCPTTDVTEHNFKAEVQGHFTIAANGRKLPNYSARANYDDYAIGTSDGNRDGRLGIKLGLPKVEILDAFLKQTDKDTSKMQNKNKDNQFKGVRDGMSDHTSDDIPGSILDKTGQPFTTQIIHDALRPLKEGCPVMSVENVTPVGQGIGLLETAESSTSPAEITSAEIVSPDEHRRKRRGSLRIDGSRRERWMHILNLIAPDQRTQEDKSNAVLEWVESHLSSAELPIHQETAQNSSDAEFEKPSPSVETDISPTLVEAVNAQAQAFRAIDRLMDKLDALEVENTTLRRERDQAIATKREVAESQPELELLRMENSRLTASLAQAQALLNNFRKSLQLIDSTAKSEPVIPQQTSALVKEVEQPQTMKPAPANLSPPAGTPGGQDMAMSTPSPATPTGVNATVATPSAEPRENLRYIRDSLQQHDICVEPTDHSKKAVPFCQGKLEPHRRTRAGAEQTAEKINAIVDALISWNTRCANTAQMLRISIPPIKGLAALMGANYQRVIQEVLKNRENELEELHSRFMLGSRHNATVHQRDQILQAIAQDYLELDNWQDVRYPS